MTTVQLVGISMGEPGVLAGPSGRLAWNGENVPQGPDPRPFFPDLDRPGRLDPATRYVLCACGLLPTLPEVLRDDTGVFLGTNAGCLGVDRDFADSIRAGRPQPALYARTLPTTPGAEVSRVLGLRGPGLAVVQEASPGAQALLAAWQEVRTGGCRAALFGQYEIPPPGQGSPFAVVGLLVANGLDVEGRDLECQRVGDPERGEPLDLREIAEASWRPEPWHRRVTVEGASWDIFLSRRSP